MTRWPHLRLSLCVVLALVPFIVGGVPAEAAGLDVETEVAASTVEQSPEPARSGSSSRPEAISLAEFLGDPMQQHHGAGVECGHQYETPNCNLCGPLSTNCSVWCSSRGGVKTFQCSGPLYCECNNGCWDSYDC